MARPKSVNLYEILGVTRESTEKEIAKAYRKKALICHPDKNPDNPKAAELFHELSEALGVLTDPKAKAAYDSVLKAKELAKLRTQALDSKRKKFKEDLEARETAAQNTKYDDHQAKKKFEDEIKRLREEGSRLLEEQQELMKTQLETDAKRRKESITPKIKVRWRSSKDDHNNGGYNEDVLKNIFSKYGPVIGVIVSLKKNGLGIVEFKEPSHALIAAEFEHGLEDNPLKISWLQGDRNSETPSDTVKCNVPTTRESPMKEMSETRVPSADAAGDDFESMVLRRLKKAQQSKAGDV